jgi:hypothetical protein
VPPKRALYKLSSELVVFYWKILNDDDYLYTGKENNDEQTYYNRCEAAFKKRQGIDQL